MKNTLKLSLTFALALIASNTFAGGEHHMKKDSGMMAQKGHMGMMDGNKMRGAKKDGMKMDKNMMAMMKKRAGMMSKCADEIEKENPNPAQLKLCSEMMRKQGKMMHSCMDKGCDMMKKGKNPHHSTDKK